ncbi:MAG: glycosyltransferase [Acidobacteria bacterium]|nr:glycosyltransferase [Acidobacteriota bacterium]MBS1865481.1 glycosyltransferase [Acidobacteriota bacterium]
MSRPFVSVLIDTYNHENFIEQAIVSVLEQDFPASGYEILVVDDGSSDRTPEIVKKFAPRVTHLPKKNGGQASAFNFGIPQCRGEIVAFLDGDDWWKPNKLACVSEAMESHPAVGIVGNGIVIVQPDGTEETEFLHQGNQFCANSLAGAKSFIVRGSFLGTSRMTIRSSVLAAIGPIPETIIFEADEYLFTIAAVLHDALILPDPLTYYRLHGSNLYQITSGDSTRLRRKQRVLEHLANSLVERLAALNADPEAARIITNNVKADADSLRLSMDGGMPWETLRTEWRLYQQVIDVASPLHRIFKFVTLLPSLFFPPRLYYRLKRSIVESAIYRRTRRQWLPNPSHGHVLRAPQTQESSQKATIDSGH